MKNIIFVVLAMLFASITSFSQSKAPKAIETSFKLKFPKATKMKWEKENAHEYEADFIENGVKHTANFNDKGEWLETESTTTFDKLPEKIKTSFKTSHNEDKIIAVAKIETSDGETHYEIEVKKVLKTVEYYYNSEDKLIK